MSIKVTIDNEEVIFPQDDQQPFINPNNNRTYIPICFPFEKIGFSVNWIERTVDNPKGTVVITNHNDGVVGDSSLIKSKCYETTFEENSTIFITNNIPYEFIYDTPMIVGGRTMLPLRKIFESIDCLVDWDSNKSTAVIYSLENNYRIKDLEGNYLTYSSVNNNTPITVEKSSNSESQIWGIRRSSEYHRHHIMTSSNNARAMNIYRGDNTCTVYDISGNVQDTSLFIQSVNNGGPVGECYIKWGAGTEIRYLSKKLIDGKTVVCWETIPFEEEPQHWILELAECKENESESDGDTETEGSESGERTIIDLPSDSTCNWNQYYSDIVNKIGSTSGCSWTCALNVANIYGPDAYEPSDMPDSAWNSENGCMWYLPNNCIGKISGYTSYTSDSDMLSLIRYEIKNNRPVVVELYNANEAYPQHFVVAYGYKGDGIFKSDILVFDPGVGNDDNPPKEGLQHTLTEAEQHNYNKTMRRIRKTSGR